MEIHYTSSIQIILRDDGIVITRPIAEMSETIELEHAIENIQKIHELKGDRRLLMIVMKDGKFSQESRQLFGNTNDLVDKVALVATNLVSEVASNFFLGFNQPEIPIKLFKNEDDALKWLKSDDLD
ncbi:MAG: STAS/SEC14 domain-containing protein [Crocinitomicaceae bacterium]